MTVRRLLPTAAASPFHPRVKDVLLTLVQVPAKEVRGGNFSSEQSDEPQMLGTIRTMTAPRRCASRAAVLLAEFTRDNPRRQSPTRAI